MDIISYLLDIVKTLYQNYCWLLLFVCKYLPLKQWAFDDSHSPKHQMFKVDELPRIRPVRQEWNYKDLISLWEKQYGKTVSPVRRRSACDIPEDCTCPNCLAPQPYLYRNNGKAGQLMCKVCSSRFAPGEGNRFSSLNLRCPHCGHSLVHKKDRR